MNWLRSSVDKFGLFCNRYHIEESVAIIVVAWMMTTLADTGLDSGTVGAMMIAAFVVVFDDETREKHKARFLKAYNKSRR